MEANISLCKLHQCMLDSAKFYFFEPYRLMNISCDFYSSLTDLQYIDSMSASVKRRENKNIAKMNY